MAWPGKVEWVMADVPDAEAEGYDGAVRQHHLVALHLLDCVRASECSVNSLEYKARWWRRWVPDTLVRTSMFLFLKVRMV